MKTKLTGIGVLIVAILAAFWTLQSPKAIEKDRPALAPIVGNHLPLKHAVKAVEASPEDTRSVTEVALNKFGLTLENSVAVSAVSEKKENSQPQP